MIPVKPLSGQSKPHAKYHDISLEEIVGKTVEAVELTGTEGAYGREPCVLLFFTDNTRHGFVLPTDAE
jgi:hypothetical protein